LNGSNILPLTENVDDAFTIKFTLPAGSSLPALPSSKLSLDAGKQAFSKIIGYHIRIIKVWQVGTAQLASTKK
jgi:hypothetical protein